VAPPRAVAPNRVDPDIVAGRVLLGLRVPTIVASPWSRGWWFFPRVHHGTFDHTSILKLIEWRWGLRPLTARDALGDVMNLACVLDFDHPHPAVPLLPRPAPPAPEPCPPSAAMWRESGAGARENNWQALLDSGLAAGWPIELNR